ncbi:cache domain-containing sensor histidine kinase [Cohnella algarum]|uniref:cache domain-containing sensor histidine kinase n=1 Tax=Cohnella algarum TaxID=2044859 RepID=UPI00196866C4|nr:sensor histidine kinase [Cohnella algarum]MBN2981617.1 histidine kinase [Cohnella algarum]
MFRSSIRNKLSAFLLVAILLPIAASILISYFYTRHSLKEDAVRENSNAVRQGATSLMNQLQQMNAISLSIYNNIQEPDSLYNILARGRSDFIVENKLYSGLHAIEQSSKDVQQVYLYSELADRSYLLIDGYLKREAGRTGLDGRYVQPVNKDDPFFEPPHPSHNYGMEEFPYSPSNTVFTIHRPVYRAPLKERIGILSIDFKLDGLLRIGDMLHDKNDENIYLMDDAGTVIFSSEERLIGQKPSDAWLQHARYSLSGAGHFEWKETGFQGIVVYEKFELIGRTWILVKQIPNEYLFRNASNVLQMNLLVLVSFLLVAVAAALLVSVKLTAPIKKLTESIKKIKLGKLQLHIDSERNDEVGVLGHAIKNMVDTIDNLIMRELRLELANKDNQLKALQAQINPHFIYNTLQSIGSVALQHQVPKIYELTSSLGLMMRYNMNTEESVVPLSKEIHHAEAYLELQKQRFKERLRYRIELGGPDAAGVTVPKMILQPLVENCFKHGFRSGMEEAEIEITAQRAGDALRIEVRDNGEGVSPERARELERLLEREAFGGSGSGAGGGTGDGARGGMVGDAGGGMGGSMGDDAGSIGLLNVASRLRLYFDDASRVSVRNLAPSGFSVVIEIPMRKAVLPA